MEALVQNMAGNRKECGEAEVGGGQETIRVAGSSKAA